jgi:hypothetical protein
MRTCGHASPPAASGHPGKPRSRPRRDHANGSLALAASGGLVVAQYGLVGIGYSAASEILIIAGAAFTLGVGSIGILVLREPDADWEHTPQFRGFRPAAGTQ